MSDRMMPKRKRLLRCLRRVLELAEVEVERHDAIQESDERYLRDVRTFTDNLDAAIKEAEGQPPEPRQRGLGDAGERLLDL